ncbi:glycosyltransferase family 4 protein [Nesterenkonia massiliensis]|uniref:Glycosyltransferase family 4 protein n=1 Tax=Nesterenkonia massiliensis TaxID=1232429 RepID=A0ABT2HN20_9MICC|nr:glycosyltransferase family 4 protein [Nesterenkonia massiliensis]MCT1606088.1 glycosyltransferase family 4 protein [Nesterenkonia massiliensis]
MPPSSSPAAQDPRLAVVADEILAVLGDPDTSSQAERLGRLEAQYPATDLVLAAAQLEADAVSLLARLGTRVPLGEREVRTVLLTTKTVTTGGVSMVLLSQARSLLEAGYRVVIAARGEGSDLHAIPAGAAFFQLEAANLSDKAAEWIQVCREHTVDVIIDHQILYTRDWPVYALAGRALGIPTIGWIHNFAGRPVYDLSGLTSFLTNHMNALAQVVTLSPLDAVYWKLRGVEHAAYLPNPVSPMILDSAAEEISKPAPRGRRVELIWWGRLDEHTKQVRQLLAVGTELKKLDVDFHLKLIGPEWRGFTPAKLNVEVRKKGLEDLIEVVGPLHGQELVDTADAADIFISTSVIEGYQLTLLEAQARGLPVVMYDLPWLVPVQDNAGIVSVPQTDPVALAREVKAIAEDPERYQLLSSASLEAVTKARTFSFSTVYQQLVTGKLPAEFSPEPSLNDAKELVDLLLFYVERHSGNRTRAAKRKAGQKSREPAAPAQSFARRALRSVARRARPYGHLALSVAPGLKPLAHRVNYALKRRLPQ